MDAQKFQARTRSPPARAGTDAGRRHAVRLTALSTGKLPGLRLPAGVVDERQRYFRPVHALRSIAERVTRAAHVGQEIEDAEPHFGALQARGKGLFQFETEASVIDPALEHAADLLLGPAFDFVTAVTPLLQAEPEWMDHVEDVAGGA